MAESTFDPMDPGHRANPHPLYHRMRRMAPVCPCPEYGTGRRLWFVTRYADVQQALRDPLLSRQPERLAPELAATHRSARSEALAALGLDRHMLNLDPPDHTRLRRLAAPAFGPRTIAAMAPRIRQVTATLLDTMASKDRPVDLIHALALPLPVVVIAELLGIPIEDQSQFRGWVHDLLYQGGDQGRRAGGEFLDYIDDHLALLRAAPGQDLLSQLVQVEQAGDRLTRTELLSAAFLLLVAGHETTVNLIGNGTLALLTHPDQLAKLRSRPTLIESAVEEILRFNGPVESTPLRYALADVTVGHVPVPQGEAVVPVLLAANRDPAVFPSPDTFDITRDPNHHLAFGHGTHFCLGAPLARLEGQIALAALVQRFSELALAVSPAELEWSTGFSVHGVLRLPVHC
jgi:cytochrome P450